jgi:translocation and assembly module TamA
VYPPARHLLLVLALGLLSAGCATSRGAQQEPPGPKVVDLEIEGAQQLKPGAIKSRILTSETPWWAFLPFIGPHYFDPEAWQADLQRIERFYQSEGYYETRILSAQVQPQGEDAVALQVHLQEGEPTLIGSVEVSGLEPLEPPVREQVLHELPLQEGERFREEDWEQAKELVAERLRERGYAQAEAGGQAQVDLATHQAQVVLQVQPGERYRFGELVIVTDPGHQVPAERIREQAEAAIHAGEWYRESALAEAQSRVYRMGVFSTVRLYRGEPDKAAQTVPIVVDVREAAFRSIRLGGGLLLDPVRQEARVLAEWTHRNVYFPGLGGLGRFTASGRVGYAFFLGSDIPSGPVFQGTAEFSQPRFLARDLRLQTSLSLERGVEQAFRFYSGRLQLGTVWQPRPTLSFFPSYNLELASLTGERIITPEAGVPPLALGCPNDSPRCLLWLSYLQQVVEWDRRDSPLEPRRGFYTALSLQEGGGPLAGSFDFLRLLPELRGYYSFGPDSRFTLAARVRVGTLLSPANPDWCPNNFRPDLGRCETPILNRFFSGGSLMRGFNNRRLSPMEAVLDESGNPTGEVVPVGGNGLFESSLELRFRPTPVLALAFFYDTGLVSQGALRLGDRVEGDRVVNGLFGRRHYHAVGVGVGYSLLGLLLRVDIGVRLNIGDPLSVSTANANPYEYPPRGWCFGLGPERSIYAGAPEGPCTFHVTIGETF